MNHHMRKDQAIKSHDAEATLFASAARIIGEVGFREISFDVGGKKSKRRYVSAKRDNGDILKMWVKPARTWRGLADAVLFPWKKYKNAHSGYHSVLFACESAKTRGVTHFLAVAGDETTGEINFSNLYPIDAIPELVFEQSQIVESRFYRAHSSSFIVLSYAPEFDEAANIACNAGCDLLALGAAQESRGKENGENSRVSRRSGRAYKRDRKVRDAVLSMAQGRCECCGEMGFETADGSRYLETHHIIEVSSRGPDSLENLVAVCANCHRKAHYSKSRLAIERAMISAIRKRGARNA